MTLDEAKREELQKVQEEVMTRVREQIAKIQRDAQREILGSVVDSSQIQRLMGKPFTFESGFQFRPGPRGDRTGAGDRATRRSRRPEGGEGAGSDSEEGSSRRRRRGS
jgi:hypothetical protein